MLRHTGAKRTFQHNIRLAILLCLNAGFINAAGFLAFQVLTTNVTGHAALLAVNIATESVKPAIKVALWLFMFLSGAFSSSFYIGKVGREKPFSYTIPILFIILILLFVAIFGHTYHHILSETEYFAGSLLFAMGMQNALVTIVSGAVVRTTHLTGMFTDLGIDLSVALLSRKNLDKAVRRRLILHGAIIFFFLCGGILGGLLFVRIGFSAFFVPVGFMLTALFYDYFRVTIRRAFHNSMFPEQRD